MSTPAQPSPSNNIANDYPSWDLQLQQQADHLEAHRSRLSRTQLPAQPASTFCNRCNSQTQGWETFRNKVPCLRPHQGAAIYSTQPYLISPRQPRELDPYLSEKKPADRLVTVLRTTIELL